MVGDADLGLTKTMFGQILAWGTAGMITGKLLTGMLADWLGGRKVFITALLIAALVTVGFGSARSFTSLAGMNYFMLWSLALD